MVANESYPAWMSRVLELIATGQKKEPIAKFETQDIAARERLRFYRFLRAEKAKGNLAAEGIVLQWTNPFESKSKTVLKFSKPEESNPLLDDEAESEEANSIEAERLLKELAKKHGGK